MKSRCTSLLTAILLAVGLSPALPHTLANQPLKETAKKTQKRVLTRAPKLPPRTAKDDQTESLTPGTVPQIPKERRVVLKVVVVDEKTGEVLPHRVHIEDRAGTYYPPKGHRDVGALRWHSNNVSYEPDVSNDGYVWAMIPSGRFDVSLPDEPDIQIRVSHGLEYPIRTVSVNLTGKAGEMVEQTVTLKRGINMRQQGWMSADTHVHNLTPLGAIRQMPIEEIDFVNLMFIGPGHALLRRTPPTGKPSLISTPDHIVAVSQEVRDANQGHMTLMRMREPIKPIQVYTGSSKLPQLKPLPNEPLNWEVFDRMHAQGGMAFHAHYLYWPGHGSAVGGALGKLDGVEWLRSDFVSRNNRTRHDISVPGFGLRAAGFMWYDMLNCGVRLPLVGGTDKMGANRVVGGSCRTYAGVDEWSQDGFLGAVAKGKTFVTNGPLLKFLANDQPIGSELRFDGKGPHTIQISAGCFTHRPIKFFEIIFNGKVVHELKVPEDQKTTTVVKEIGVSKSGWLALRARHDKPNGDNWHWGVTAAHSSPIYVTVNGQMPAVEESARYLVGRLDTTLKWATESAIWSGSTSRNKAITSFKAARKFYADALKRAGSE